MSPVRMMCAMALVIMFSVSGCTLGPDFARIVVREVVFNQLEIPIGLVLVRGDDLAIVPNAGCMRFADAPADGDAQVTAAAGEATAHPGTTPLREESMRVIIAWNEPAPPVAVSTWYPISELPSLLASGGLEPQLVLVASPEAVSSERFEDLCDTLSKHGLIVMQSGPLEYTADGPG